MARASLASRSLRVLDLHPFHAVLGFHVAEPNVQVVDLCLQLRSIVFELLGLPAPFHDLALQLGKAELGFLDPQPEGFQLLSPLDDARILLAAVPPDVRTKRERLRSVYSGNMTLNI